MNEINTSRVCGLLDELSTRKNLGDLRATLGISLSSRLYIWTFTSVIKTDIISLHATLLYYSGNYVVRGFIIGWLRRRRRTRLRRLETTFSIERNPRCSLIGRVIFCQNIFHPAPVACISFFLAELNFSKTSILSAPGSIFHQTISPSTSRSLIPSVTSTFLCSPIYPAISIRTRIVFGIRYHYRHDL